MDNPVPLAALYVMSYVMSINGDLQITGVYPADSWATTQLFGKKITHIFQVEFSS